MILQGSETNLLGLYLCQGRTFPDANLMVVNDDIWAGLRDRQDFKLRKEADKDSYAWDQLIAMLSDPEPTAFGEFGAELTEFELALRVMALETRFARRVLGRALREFLAQALAGNLRSRVMVGPSGVVYVITSFGA